MATARKGAVKPVAPDNTVSFELPKPVVVKARAEIKIRDYTNFITYASGQQPAGMTSEDVFGLISSFCNYSVEEIKDLLYGQYNNLLNVIANELNNFDPNSKPGK